MPEGDAQTALERQIRSQPEALSQVPPSAKAHGPDRGGRPRAHRAHRIWLVGTGTSHHAAELGAAMLQEAGRAAQAVLLDALRRLGAGRGSAGRRHRHHAHRGDGVRPGRARRGLQRGPGRDHDHAPGLRVSPTPSRRVDKETSETYTASYTADAGGDRACWRSSWGRSSFSPDTLHRPARGRGDRHRRPRDRRGARRRARHRHHRARAPRPSRPARAR